MRKAVGPKIEAVATIAPQKPATCQPIRVTSSEPGPGAMREIAKVFTNWASVIQWCTLTTCRWMSATTACPPPIVTRESGAKTVKRSQSCFIMRRCFRTGPATPRQC